MKIIDLLNAARIGSDVVAIKAFRNKGEKAQITVMFAQRVEKRGDMGISFRVMAASGQTRNFDSSLTCLLPMLEEQYKKAFAGVPVPSEEEEIVIVDNAITADLVFESLMGQLPPHAANLRVVESINPADYCDASGKVLPNWAAKIAGDLGIGLTHNGKPIYRTVELDFEGKSHQLIQHTENLKKDPLTQFHELLQGKAVAQTA